MEKSFIRFYRHLSMRKTFLYANIHKRLEYSEGIMMQKGFLPSKPTKAEKSNGEHKSNSQRTTNTIFLTIKIT